MSTTLLSLVDRLTQKVGPVSYALDTIVGRLVPQKTASACSGVHCGFLCTNQSCAGGFFKCDLYSISGGGCVSGFYTCQTNCQCLC